MNHSTVSAAYSPTGGLNQTCEGRSHVCNTGLICNPTTLKCVSVYASTPITVTGTAGDTAGGSSAGSGGTQTSAPTNSTGNALWNGGGLDNPLNSNNLTELLSAILGFVQTIGAIFVVLMLIWTGFKFVHAQGNSTELKSARESLLWTVIGALILLGATAISLGIEATVKSL